MSASFAVRTAMAAAGIALLAMAGRSLRPRSHGKGRRDVCIDFVERRLIATARIARPLARRSTVLRREAAADAVARRLALAGEASWVVRAALALVADADKGAGGPARPGFGRDQEAEALIDAMAALRAGIAMSVLLLAVPMAAWVGGAALVAPACAAGLASALLPDAALAQHGAAAARRVDVAMPDTLELLAACCRGGLALESALAVTAGHAPQPLRGILDRSRRRQRAGEPPAAALRVEAEAVGVDEISAIGRLVERHHQLGLPLESPLLARATAARARARVAMLARAGRGVPVASLLVATVVAPCCVGVLATWVILAVVGQTGLG
jgi:Flp pilus assembly protein TadB